MLTLIVLAISGQVSQPAPLPADAPLVAESSLGIRRELTGMTREQLEQESLRLDRLRPKFFGPAALMITAGVAAYSSLVLFIGWIAESMQGACISFGFGCSGASHPNPKVQTNFLVSGFGTLGVGVAGLVVGGILLKLRGNDRVPYSRAIEAVEERLEALEKPEPPPTAVPPGLAPAL